MTCPLCQCVYKAIIGYSVPREGSTTLCNHCGAIMVVRVVGKSMELREPTKEELERLEAIPGFLEFVSRLKQESREPREPD